MSALILAAERRLSRTRTAAARTADLVESWPARRVLAGLIAVQWLAVLALALVVRHSGWIYYQGGDQLWHYTLAWLLGHGQLTQTPVGFGWALLLAPIARIAGPNLVTALPAIVLLNVLVLLPAAMCALYGIAARIGGRLFGYWALVVWILVPFVGIRLTNDGYHQRYTELTLPQSFGLTAMSDYPSMVAALVSLYFVAKVVLDRSPDLVDALAGGAAAGVAIAVKPSTSVFLAGPALAFALRRRLVGAAAFGAGLLPSLLALAVWKDRGLGNVPLLGAPGRAGDALAAAAPPLGGIDLGKYLHNVSWDRFLWNLDLLREHFWSARLIEWLVIAGLIALGRRSRPMLLLLGGTFAAFAVVKGGYLFGSIEDSSTFRLMMPAYPCFVLMIAALPLLVPRAIRGVAPWQPVVPPPSRRTRWALLGVSIAVSAVLPLAAFAAVDTHGSHLPVLVNSTGMPVPGDIGIGLTGGVADGTVSLRWRGASSAGGPVFYRILRSRSDGLDCPTTGGSAMICTLSMPEIGVTHDADATDRPGSGRWTYRIGVAANWLNDPGYGDVYMVSRPLTIRVP